MKKYLTSLIIVTLVLPNIAFASWWNPFSWNIFSKVFKPKAEMVQTATSTNIVTEEIVEIDKSESKVENVSPTVKTTQDSLQ